VSNKRAFATFAPLLKNPEQLKDEILCDEVLAPCEGGLYLAPDHDHNTEGNREGT